MSYVPKYVLKRLFPEDAFKEVAGGVELLLKNILTTIPVDQIPGNPLDLIDIKINGVALTTDEKAKISIDFEGNKFMLGNIQTAGPIPVGAELKFFFPSSMKKGDAAKLEITVDLVNVHIEVERTIA